MGWVSQATNKVVEAVAPVTNAVSETLGTSGSGSKTLGINTDDLSKTLTTDSSTSGLGALGKELTNNELVNAAAVAAATYFGGPLGAAAANGLISRAQGNDWNQVANNAAGAGLLAYGAGQLVDLPSYDWSSASAPLSGAEAGLTEGISYGGGGANTAVEAITPQYSVNQAVASGMSPGSMGASMATDYTTMNGAAALTDAQIAAAQGVVTKSALPGLYEMAQVGNAAALTNQLADAGSAANIAKMLGGSGGQPNLSQMAINILQAKDQGTNPGGLLTPSLMPTAPVQQESSILKSLPQLSFGHAPTVAALANRTAPQGYKRGGLAHHQPEFITGATGHYVKGKGDGQSDDIPAMLADGEYVFDADTVAALGNGSSDAGAERLDEMRKAIRKHKRSAPVDKIPPKAKSPLEYLKG
jgi:hypothetical protein